MQEINYQDQISLFKISLNYTKLQSHTRCFNIKDLPLSFFPQKKSEIPIFRVVKAQRSPILCGAGRKVLFVHRKPSEQTG